MEVLTIVSGDTTLIESGLEPNKPYSFQLKTQKGAITMASDKVVAQTLDTTDNNYSWQVYDFGDPSTGYPSILYDVSIINDNDIWAVGEIHVNDTAGTYNAVHWNGSKWELKTVPFITPDSIVYYPSIKAIKTYSIDKILFSNGGCIAKFNGNHFEMDCGMNKLLKGSITSLFSEDTNLVYAIGLKGTIVRSSGSFWSQIKSNTTLGIFDIYSNNGTDIYAAGGDFNSYSGVLLKGNANGFNVLKEGTARVDAPQMFNPYFVGIARTVWVSDQNTVYFGGNLLYKYQFGLWSLVKSFEGNYPGENSNGQYFGFISQVRGNSDNDIILVGEGNTVRHFNGVRWQQIGMPYNISNNYTWLSVNVKGSIAVAVGYKDNTAILMTLKR